MKNNLNFKYQLANIGLFATAAAMMAFASNYMLDLGFNNSTIGFVLSLTSILSVFLQPAIANFADNHPQYSLQKIINVLLLILAVISVLLYFAGILLGSNFIVLVLVVGVFCMLNSSMPLFNTLAFIYEKFGVSINYGVARGLGSASYAVVSMGLGYVIKWMSPKVLPLTYCLFVMITFFAVKSYVLKGHANERQKVSASQKDAGNKISILAFFGKYKRLTILFIGFALLYSGHMLINNFLIQIVTEVGGDASTMGIAVFIAAIMELPAMFGFNWLNKTFGVKKLIIISMIFTAIKHFLTYLAGNMMMIYICSFIQALAYAIYIPALVYYVNDVVSESDLLMGQSMNTTFMTLGGVIGSLLGGVLMDSLGIKTTLLVGAVVTIIGAAIIIMSLMGKSPAKTKTA